MFAQGTTHPLLPQPQPTGRALATAPRDRPPVHWTPDPLSAHSSGCNQISEHTQPLCPAAPHQPRRACCPLSSVIHLQKARPSTGIPDGRGRAGPESPDPTSEPRGPRAPSGAGFLAPHGHCSPTWSRGGDLDSLATGQSRLQTSVPSPGAPRGRAGVENRILPPELTSTGIHHIRPGPGALLCPLRGCSCTSALRGRCKRGN